MPSRRIDGDDEEERGRGRDDEEHLAEQRE
jgi:hypothetical protein